MARFDVYRNEGPLATTTPYVVEVQSGLLHSLDSCVVVPLRRVDQFAQVALPERLTPCFEVEGLVCLFEAPKLAAVPRRVLRERVASLASEQNRITGALDFLFQGY